MGQQWDELTIDGKEIQRRMEFLRFGPEDAVLLLNCREGVERELTGVVAEFYRREGAEQEVARLIGDAETLQRLHGAMERYVLDLFGGNFGTEYVQNRLRIGLVHKQIGVEPKLYLSAVRTLKELLFALLHRQIPDLALAGKTCRALDKLLYFDITLVFDTYIRSLVHEVETERKSVESYAASLELQVEERTRLLEEKVSQLESALAAVKRLEGVIPICGVCKKIRNDQESWQQLEQYISEHSEAMFSHGLCPDCFARQMRELTAEDEARGER